MFKLETKNGYDFFEAASCLQKAIRRADVMLAGYFALELFESGYANYVWKRLMTVSAEDCYGAITKEIEALRQGFLLVNNGTMKKAKKGRIFISKAVILLCATPKSRDADNYQNLIFDAGKISEDEVRQYIKEIREMPKQEVPDYAYDVHTIKGKRRGKTKKQFFIDEYESLYPKQMGLFDYTIKELKQK